MAADIVPIVLRVPRREVAYVKFVFESYEGVAITRTLDRHAADVVVLVAPDFVADARRVVDALRAEGVCEEIANPEGYDGDWLGPEPGDEPA
jgi:deoxyxylulose-5-phosphate synthase